MANRKNQGKIYNHNSDLTFMTVTDRNNILITTFSNTNERE